MSSCSVSTGNTSYTTTTTDHPITSIHPDIIKSHILNKLDGPTLASTGCAAAQLFSLCSDDHLWKDICNSTWPSTSHPRVSSAISSFPSAHRSFYSDSFPSLRFHNIKNQSNQTLNNHHHVSEFISAVDIYYDDKLLYSKVLVTETTSSWFLTSPFQVELLGPKEIVTTPLKYETEEGACMQHAKERLRVSWILIDPVKKRAVNVASLKPVEVRRHWLTEEIQLRFVTMVEMVQWGVLVTCGGTEEGELHVREVSMQLEDIEGRILTGMESLVILNDAMEGQRRKSDTEFDKNIYQMFLKKRLENRESKQRRERNFDILFIFTGISIFFGIWILFSSA